MGNAAQRVRYAVDAVVRAGVLTHDVGGSATTREVTDAIIKEIRGDWGKLKEIRISLISSNFL